MQKNNYKYIILLSAIICFNIIFNYIFLSRNPTYFDVCDQIHHLNNKVYFSHQLGNILNNAGSFPAKFKEVISLFNTCSWPRLVYFNTSVINSVFGKSTFITELSNIPYIIILLISVYLIGKDYFGVKLAGLLSAFILSVFPIIRQYSVAYGLDLPLASLTALGMFFLCHPENFRKIGYSLKFGIILGLGILIKGQILIFLLGPLSYVGVKMVHKKERSAFINLLSSLMIAALISSIWWYGQFAGLLKDLLWATHYNKMSTDCKWPVSLWPFYYLIQAASGTSIPLFIVFIISLTVFLRSKEVRDKLLLLLWLLVPYLILTFMRTKWDRFFLPAFPAMALITSYGFLKLKNKKCRQAAVIFLIIFGLLVSLGVYKNRQRDNYEKMIGILVATIETGLKVDNIKIGIIEDGDFNRNREAGIVRYLAGLNLPSSQIYLSNESKADFFSNREDFDFVILGYCAQCDAAAVIHEFPQALINTTRKEESFEDNVPFHNKEELIKLLEGSGRWVYLKEVILSPDTVHIFLFRSRK